MKASLLLDVLWTKPWVWLKVFFLNLLSQFENGTPAPITIWLCAIIYQCHILYDTWTTVSGDIIDTILGEKIKTNRPIGHKCRSFIRALLIDFPVGNFTLMKWVGTNMHGPVITLTPSYPQPLASGWRGGLLGRDNCLRGGQEGRLGLGPKDVHAFSMLSLWWESARGTIRDVITTHLKRHTLKMFVSTISNSYTYIFNGKDHRFKWGRGHSVTNIKLKHMFMLHSYTPAALNSWSIFTSKLWLYLFSCVWSFYQHNHDWLCVTIIFVYKRGL